jgi:hypothetical protein
MLSPGQGHLEILRQQLAKGEADAIRSVDDSASSRVDALFFS